MRNGQFVNRGALLKNKLTCSSCIFHCPQRGTRPCVNPFYILMLTGVVWSSGKNYKDSILNSWLLCDVQCHANDSNHYTVGINSLKMILSIKF